jgi:hypothetical protein
MAPPMSVSRYPRETSRVKLIQKPATPAITQKYSSGQLVNRQNSQAKTVIKNPDTEKYRRPGTIVMKKNFVLTVSADPSRNAVPLLLPCTGADSRVLRGKTHSFALSGSQLNLQPPSGAPSLLPLHQFSCSPGPAG